MAWKLMVMLMAIAVAIVANTPARYAQSPGKIVFHSERDGNFEIYVMNPDGTMPTRLTNTPDPERTPAFSPDKQKIVFAVARRVGFGIQSEILTMNGDGLNRKFLRSGFPGPAFSPQGNNIAFADRLGFGTTLDIYIMDANGLNVKHLTDHPGNDTDPAFSPDGKTIAFVSDRDAKSPIDSDIYTMNVDGSNVVRLTQTGDNSDPNFSPDGSKIVFTSARDQLGAQVYIMNTNGANVRRLTGGSVRAGTPAVSPDGGKIVFSNWVGGANFEIFVMDADGANVTRLTNAPGEDGSPDWR